MDAQFGFRRRLSIDHAHLVLRTCCDLALAIGEPIALVKLDVSKAYARVDRAVLWGVMNMMQYPQGFIGLIVAGLCNMQRVPCYRGSPVTYRTPCRTDPIVGTIPLLPRIGTHESNPVSILWPTQLRDAIAPSGHRLVSVLASLGQHPPRGCARNILRSQGERSITLMQ